MICDIFIIIVNFADKMNTLKHILFLIFLCISFFGVNAEHVIMHCNHEGTYTLVGMNMVTADVCATEVHETDVKSPAPTTCCKHCKSHAKSVNRSGSMQENECMDFLVMKNLPIIHNCYELVINALFVACFISEGFTLLQRKVIESSPCILTCEAHHAPPREMLVKKHSLLI